MMTKRKHVWISLPLTAVILTAGIWGRAMEPDAAASGLAAPMTLPNGPSQAPIPTVQAKIAQAKIAQAKIGRAPLAQAPIAEAPMVQVGGVAMLSNIKWRLRCGDDPGWAAPDFNDSAWATISASSPWSAQTANKICWVRTRMQIPPGLADPGISVVAWQANSQVFVNGVLVGDTGGMPPRASPQVNTFRDFAISPKLVSNGDVTIALRLWHYGTGGPIPAFMVHVGLMPELRSTRGFQLVAMLPSLVPVFTGLGVALLAIGLFRDQRDRREYFWLSVYGIAFALHTALILLAGYKPWSARFVYGSSVLANGILLVTFIEFFLAFMGIRPRPWVRIYQTCLVVAPTVLEIVYLQQPIAYRVGVAMLVPATVVLVGILAVQYRRKNPAAGVLILPTLLALGIFTVQSVAAILQEYHFNMIWLLRLLIWNVGYFQITVYSVSLMLFWLSIGLIILLRAHRATEDQARLTGEIEAARGVQQLLLASAGPAAEGFRSESVYLPASEVGGDFYHLSRGDDGSLLVVVGDVSGKGLRAAMTVSAIIGCLRGGGTRAPEAVLKNLNTMLTGQITGFVTCCAALLEADGTATFSNAGHINPYLEGSEIPLAGNLPLGLVNAVEYASEQFLLDDGDQLTFLSDGVVEATNQANELFGFERARAMSLDSALTIAHAARDFGQEDDISVVAVTFQPVAVANAPGTPG